MMIEIEIPKDIRKYEAKLVGPFTPRQTICVAIAAVCSIIAYNAAGDLLSANSKVFLCMLTSTPALLFGWLKPYGMTLEQFLKTTFITFVLAPTKRKYKTANKYDEYDLEYVNELKLKKEKRLKSVEKFKKQNRNPEFISYK